MRIAFMGTPDFAVPALAALVAAGHDIAAVYTQPPRPAGRGRSLTSSPIQRRATELGLPVRSPINFREEVDRAAWAALDLDIAIVAAYGLILPQVILDAPRLGCVNIHASLLPRWRGAAPIQRAILAGDPETGVTIMQMERGLDTGPMLLTSRTRIADKTAGELTLELAQMGAGLIVETLVRLPDLSPTPQPASGVTYASKIDKAEARLDFGRSAPEVLAAIRAFNPAPGAFIELGDKRVKILAAEMIDASGAAGSILDDQLTIACSSGAIRPKLVQPAGKPPMSASDFLRGNPVAGTC